MVLYQLNQIKKYMVQNQESMVGGEALQYRAFASCCDNSCGLKAGANIFGNFR
jgi:hypothetical protein